MDTIHRADRIIAALAFCKQQEREQDAEMDAADLLAAVPQQRQPDRRWTP